MALSSMESPHRFIGKQPDLRWPNVPIIAPPPMLYKNWQPGRPQIYAHAPSKHELELGLAGGGPASAAATTGWPWRFGRLRGARRRPGTVPFGPGRRSDVAKARLGRTGRVRATGAASTAPAASRVGLLPGNLFRPARGTGRAAQGPGDIHEGTATGRPAAGAEWRGTRRQAAPSSNQIAFLTGGSPWRKDSVSMLNSAFR